MRTEPPPNYSIHEISCSQRPTIYGWTPCKMGSDATIQDVLRVMHKGRRAGSRAAALEGAWAHYDEGQRANAEMDPDEASIDDEMAARKFGTS